MSEKIYIETITAKTTQLKELQGDSVQYWIEALWRGNDKHSKFPVFWVVSGDIDDPDLRVRCDTWRESLEKMVEILDEDLASIRKLTD